MAKEPAFTAIIESDKDRRHLTRNFEKGAEPQIYLGTPEGALHITARVNEDSNVIVTIEKSKWSVDGKQRGVCELIYEGRIS